MISDLKTIDFQEYTDSAQHIWELQCKEIR